MLPLSLPAQAPLLKIVYHEYELLSIHHTIAIPAYVVDVFKEQSLKQKEWRLKAGPLWSNDINLVFTREDGSPMPHSTVSNAFKQIVDKMDHHEWSFHSLRHTFVTDELRSGTDVKTVSVLAGHSTTSFTLDTYAAEKGKKLGRPHTTKDRIPAIFYKHYPAYAAGKMNVSELARVCGLSRPTVYKYIKLVR